MELDELKNTWRQYDQNLEKNLKLNEQLFRSLKLDASRKAMNTPLKCDVISSVMTAILLWIIVRYLPIFFQDTILLISSLVMIIYCLIALTFSIKRITALSKIDYYNSSVFDLQKKLSDFKRMYHKFKRIELFITPLVVAVGPLTLKVLYNEDVSNDPVLLIVVFIGVILGLGIGIPIYFWINKHAYEEQIKATNQFLKELEEFKNEL